EIGDITGEAAWFRTASANNPHPVIKLNRHPNSTSNFVEGINFDGTSATAKFHIDKNGTFVAGSDFAEAFTAKDGRGRYEPGDVLVLVPDQAGTIERCSRRYDTKVAGVYSTRPGVLGADKDGQTRVDIEDVPVAIV